jgi:hypothetical protein
MVRNSVVRRLLWVLPGIVILSLLLAAQPASAAPRQRCFSETGFCVSGPILTYWERNGGLPVFGYPISALTTETVEQWSGPIQWFERDRLEDHGTSGVLAGRLGAQVLELQGRRWQTLPQVSSAPQGCRFFPQTGHSLCGVFLNDWHGHGGVERFGYPVSEPMTETLSSGDTLWTGTVQYFERRRMEYHAENAGTRYEVLLGLLGRDARALDLSLGLCADVVGPLRKTAQAYAGSFGCAEPLPQINIPIAVQPFERGVMVWVSMLPTFSRGDFSGPTIFVIYVDNQRNRLVWEGYSDTWQEGASVPSETPPAGLSSPIRGFGQLWYTNQHVRDTLGWGAAPEQADTGIIQSFAPGNGRWLLHRANIDRIYLFYDDRHVDDIARIP